MSDLPPSPRDPSDDEGRDAGADVSPDDDAPPSDRTDEGDDPGFGLCDGDQLGGGWASDASI